MECRSGCGACCIAISISSPIPGMPYGKPAGTRCVHLSGENRCVLHADPAYPQVCRNLKPDGEMCGKNFAHALAYLEQLELLTKP
jgi:uncharacterized protein